MAPKMIAIVKRIGKSFIFISVFTPQRPYIKNIIMKIYLYVG